MDNSFTPADHENTPKSTSTSEKPPATPSAFGWRTVVIGAIVVSILGGAFLLQRGIPQASLASKSKTVDVSTQAEAANSDQPLALKWRVVTAGPSPFNSNAWTARLELSATGGNGQYIFWVNNQRLPDISPNQFTLDSSACDVVGQVVGVTSNGQAAAQTLAVHSPFPSCPVP